MTQTLSEKIVNFIGTGKDPTELDNLELLSTAEITALDGITAGTITASKAVIVDANKDIGDFRNLDAVNFDAGASGTAGTVDIFPATASKGKLSISCNDQTGNTTVSLVAGQMGAARTITIPDPGGAASVLLTTGTATSTTATTAEINKLDDSVTVLTPGSGVSSAETNVSGYWRNGGVFYTWIVVDLTGLVGSATDLDIIGDTGGAANAHFGQIVAASSGTIVGGKVTCLEVPTGGADDIDFYSASVGTGAQDADVSALADAAALVTSGGAWTSGQSKGMTSLPGANHYIYIANGEGAAGGTFTAGKFLIEFYGKE